MQTRIESSSTATSERVAALIVSHRPVITDLVRLIAEIKSQVFLVAVVDNGSSAAVQSRLQELSGGPIHSVLLPENRGVAAAQNLGIDWARRQGATHVLLLDQDSRPAAGMVRQLLAAAGELTCQGFAVAAIGPRFLDPRQPAPPPFIRFEGLRLKRCGCRRPAGIVPAAYLISSGCLIPMSVLEAVGGMREELFIDYVDIEWGLRARRHGYLCFGALGAGMHHHLGEEPLRFFSRSVPAHQPLRHYYHCRNAVYLYRQKWLPLSWKVADSWRLLRKYGFYSLFAKPRRRHWWMMTMGIWHGMRGRMGRLDSP